MGTHSPIGQHKGSLILFDGVCNLCNGAVQFIIRRDPAQKFSFVSLQSHTAKKLIGDAVPETENIYSILLIRDGKIFDRSDAVLEIAKELTGSWSWLYILRFLPKFFRDAVYKLVANNRYRLFGKTDSCAMPTPELRARFLE